MYLKFFLFFCLIVSGFMVTLWSYAKIQTGRPFTPQEQANMQGFIQEMVTKNGFDATELASVLKRARFIPRSYQLMMPMPKETVKDWYKYRSRYIDAQRIQIGVSFWDDYADVLFRAEKEYGVPAEIIVGIMGVETVFGTNKGDFSVMDVLATLGFDYPDTPKRESRMKFFRQELAEFLIYARDNKIDPFSMRGSYAGAIGWPQFMPSNIRKLGVDFTGTGKIDLVNSPVDAIGSVANYLKTVGWKPGLLPVFPAVVATSKSTQQPCWKPFLNQGLIAKFTLKELAANGCIKPAHVPGAAIPEGVPFGLIDLENGILPAEYWLGTNNFFAITQYNRSYFYAMSVIELGSAVRQARELRYTKQNAQNN